MADEIKYDARKGESGLTLYAVVQNSDGASADAGKFWNGSAWEAKAAANWANYAVALSESSGNHQYVGTMPATGSLAAAALVTIHVHEREGATAAVTDPKLASQEFAWSGLKLLDIAQAVEQLLAVVAGRANYDPATGVCTFYYRDGATVAATVTCTGAGNRSDSALS